MKPQFKLVDPNEKKTPEYTHEFENALDLIRFGDKQTMRILNALELLYSALRNNIIVVSYATQRIRCLDFLDVFTELSKTDKEQRTTRQWKRMTSLARLVANDLKYGIYSDPTIIIQFRTAYDAAFMKNWTTRDVSHE